MTPNFIPDGRMSLEPESHLQSTRVTQGPSEGLRANAPVRNLHEHSQRAISTVQVPLERVLQAKQSFDARHFKPTEDLRLLQGDLKPCPGDLVLARITEIGHHKKLQLTDGSRSEFYLGDEIIVAYGNRYAPSQWQAFVPENLKACHLAAAGGLAGQVSFVNDRMSDPTAIQPIGLLADSRGQRINSRQFSLADPGKLTNIPPTIVVLGTSMDSGKTTTGAAIVNGLKKAGLRVGAAKVTGTGACGDLVKFKDAGASEVLDFVDAGLPTTYLQPLSEIQRVVRTLLGSLIEHGAQALVVEVADGLLQTETADLLNSQTFHEMGVGVVFASRDALAAIDGEKRLLEQGYDVRAISGIVSSSPLSSVEVMTHSKAPVRTRFELADSRIALDLLRLDRGQSAAL